MVIFSSFHELMQSRGVRRPSVCPSVCKLLRKSLLLPQTWLDRHQTYKTWSSHGPASRVCSRSRSRSKVTWYWHFCDVTKCLLVRSHVLSLHALTLWNTIILSFQYKCQAARCLSIGMSYSVIDGLVCISDIARQRDNIHCPENLTGAVPQTLRGSEPSYATGLGRGLHCVFAY